MYRVYFGPYLKGMHTTPIEAGRHAKRLLLTRTLGLTRGRGLPVRVYSPRGCSIQYGATR